MDILGKSEVWDADWKIPATTCSTQWLVAAPIAAHLAVFVVWFAEDTGKERRT